MEGGIRSPYHATELITIDLMEFDPLVNIIDLSINEILNSNGLAAIFEQCVCMTAAQEARDSGDKNMCAQFLDVQVGDRPRECPCQFR